MILEDDKEETAEIALCVSVFVHYGVEPKVLPLEDLSSSGLKTSFNDLLKELEDGFSLNNVILQRYWSGAAEHNDNVTNNLSVPISVLVVACGAAGMILGVTLLLMYNRHKNRRRQARIVRGWSAIEDTIAVSLSAFCLASGHTLV